MRTHLLVIYGFEKSSSKYTHFLTICPGVTQQIFKLPGLKTELWVKPGGADAPDDHGQCPERKGASEESEVEGLCPQKGTWRGEDAVVARSFGIPIQGEEPRSRSLPAEPCVWLTGFILVPGQFIDLTREL